MTRVRRVIPAHTDSVVIRVSADRLVFMVRLVYPESRDPPAIPEPLVSTVKTVATDRMVFLAWRVYPECPDLADMPASLAARARRVNRQRRTVITRRARRVSPVGGALPVWLDHKDFLEKRASAATVDLTEPKDPGVSTV